MQDLKTQNKPKNLRTGCHFYNEKMEFDVYNGESSNADTIRYLIPLNKHILEPLGFEAVCDDYTSEMYFQRDIEGYRVRTILSLHTLLLCSTKSATRCASIRHKNNSNHIYSYTLIPQNP